MVSSERNRICMVTEAPAGAIRRDPAWKPNAMAINCSFEALTSFEQMECVRREWEQFQSSPETDIDFVRLIIESRAEVQGPYVLALRQDGKVEALLVGRVERVRLSGVPGRPAGLQPRLKVLEVLHGGLLGDWQEEHLDGLLGLLWTCLARGDWQAVRFRMLNLQSPLWARCKLRFPRLCRGCVAAPNPHWSLRLPKSYEEFLKSLDGKTRRNIKRQQKLLESEFSDLSIKCLDRVGDLDTIVKTADSIISKTYQNGFNKPWTSDEMRKRLALWLSRGLSQSFFLYAHGQACAYYHILKYRGGAFALETAYDPDFQRYGVGHYIQFRAFERLCNEQGPVKVDYGFGDAQYKRQLCQCRQEEADLVLFGPNCAGLYGNVMRTVEIKAFQVMKNTLGSSGLLTRVKKAWRNSRRKNP